MFAKLTALFSKTIFLALLLLGPQACAPALYHVTLKYEPSEKFLKSEETKPDFLLTVAMFRDIQQTNDKLQLGTVTSMNGVEFRFSPKM